MVLIVDDESTLRDVLADFLRDEGYDVATASDGREAVAMIARDVPDLVLMDVMMPRTDGPTAYQALRALPNGATVPVVMMSAVRRRDGLDSSIDGFLPKPFDLEELLQQVVRLIGRA